MALYNLIGRRRGHDVIDAVLLVAEKLCVNIFLFQFFSAYIRFFVNVLIEMNVNISNELNFFPLGFIHFARYPV